MAESIDTDIIKSSNKKNTLSLKEYILKYIVYLPLFILSIGVCLSVAYVYLRYQVPYYNSYISILIKDDKGSRGSTDALEEIVLFKSKTNLSNEIEILRSATLMERVVRTLNLNTLYAVEGNLKRTETYKTAAFFFENVFQKDSTQSFNVVLNFNDKKQFQVEGLSKKWYNSGDLIKAKHGDYKIFVVNPGGINTEYKYMVDWVPSFQTASSIAPGVNIRQLNNQASILRASITTEIPQKGVDILNELVRAYNGSIIENKNRVVENTIRFIDNRLILLTSELGKVEQGLQDFRQKNEIVNIQEQGGREYQELQAAEDQLSEQEVRLQVIDLIYQYVNNPNKKFSLVPSSLGIEDPTLASLVSNYNVLQLDREEKLKTMPAANPAVQLIESQLEKVRLSIIENLTIIKRSTQPLRNKLLTERNRGRSKVRAMPSKERELLEIARQQGIKEKLYLFLLQKREESAISIASSTSNSASIDPAVAGWTPISPDRAGSYRMALIIGLLIPISLIYIRELLNDKVTTRADIVRVTDMPVIGEISNHKMKNREFVVGDKDRSVISEQFRVARTNLQFFIGNTKSPVILVTSSMAGEGKTFTSMNLAAVMAVANKKTVLLELDLRKPKISKALKLESSNGISNFVIGSANLADLPVKVKNFENLYIVPAGPIPPNPSELLLHERLDILMNYLKENFDFIIIDSAPIGLVSDAKVLSRFVDTTVYVIRQLYTPRKQMEYINELYEKKAFPNVGILVNDVKLGGVDSYYGYSYRYGYGYGYGYGYNYNMSYNYGYSEKEEKPQNWFQRLFKSGK